MNLVVKNKLILKSLRDLWHIKIRTITIILIIASGVSVYAGTYMGLEIIRYTSKVLYKSLHLADLQVNFIPVTDEETPSIKEIKKIRGIKGITKRLILPGCIELKNNEIIAALFILLKPNYHPEVNNIKITCGEYLSGEDNEGVVIDVGLAKEYGYKIGDTITIGMQGFFRNVRVRGIAVSPEFLIMTADPSLYIPIKGSLGVIYLSSNIIEDTFGYEIINNISISLYNGVKWGEIQSSLENLLNNEEVEIVEEIPKEEQYSYKAIEKDFNVLSVILPFIIIIFNIVAFLVTLIIINRLVYTQRQEIGLLMALGYNRGDILKSYLLIGLIVGTLGCVIGIFGALGLSYLVCETYKKASGLPEIIYTFIPWPLIESSLLGIIAVAIGCILPVFKVMRLTPSQAMKGYTGVIYRKSSQWKNRKTILGFFNLSSTIKMGFRNLLRKRRFLVFSVVCISCSIGMATSFIISDTSIFKTLEDYFEKEMWDVVVKFDGVVESENLEQIKAIEEIKTIEPYLKGFAKIKYKDFIKPYQIVGVEPKSKIRGLSLLSGNTFSKENAGEIILNKNTVDTLGVQIGDNIEVISEKKTCSLRLIGIMNNFVIGQAFIPLKKSQEILGLEDKVSGVLTKISNPSTSLKRKLYKIDCVSHVIFKDAVQRGVIESCSKVSPFLHLYALLSILVTILLLLANLNLNILEDREKEYAILLSLGYNKISIASIILTEVIVTGVLAIILSIPLSIIIAHILSYQVGKVAVVIDVYPCFADFAKLLFPAFFLMFTVVYFGVRYIFKINIPEVIRNRIMG